MLLSPPTGNSRDEKRIRVIIKKGVQERVNLHIHSPRASVRLLESETVASFWRFPNPTISLPFIYTQR
jgi:hypothetical protein